MSFDIFPEGSSAKERLLFVSILLSLSALTIVDLISDYAEGETAHHIVIESFIVIICMIGLGYILIEYFEKKRLTATIAKDLERTEQDLKKWRDEAQRHLRGLSEAIEHQFERWKFTPAQTEIGFLLLKGLSFKEIAEVRSTSERTVRQQSLEIYKKARLAGRAELSAFFLEDLLLPQTS